MAEDIKEILTEYKEETKRHFDVVAERLEDKIAGVAEQKVGRDEFVVLEKRVSMLEAKTK
ncbi:MAG: hypothetical protein NT012_03345 [Candidatus Nealsonbacteria bacterium]|nr:hypothetical protein [Candidatus Nealsonbacteria bacterium]